MVTDVTVNNGGLSVSSASGKSVHSVIVDIVGMRGNFAPCDGEIFGLYFPNYG